MSKTYTTRMWCTSTTTYTAFKKGLLQPADLVECPDDMSGQGWIEVGTATVEFTPLTTEQIEGLHRAALQKRFAADMAAL